MLFQMAFSSDKHYKKRMMRKVLKTWRNSTMDEKKFEIKYRVARTTEREIDKTQKGNFRLLEYNQ